LIHKGIAAMLEALRWKGREGKEREENNDNDLQEHVSSRS